MTRHQTWRHIVYVGMYPRETVFSALRSVFPAAADSFEECPLGSSALLAFAVSDKGEMLEGSVVLSACAWATARALDPGPRSALWLDGFADLEGEFKMQLDEMYLGDERQLAKVLGSDPATALGPGRPADPTYSTSRSAAPGAGYTWSAIARHGCATATSTYSPTASRTTTLGPERCTSRGGGRARS